MKTNQIALCLIASAALVACDRQNSHPASEPSPQTSSELASRFAAAEKIADISAQDDAFGKLAQDAATSGDLKMARRALELIRKVEATDEAASKCALVLVQGGQSKAASEFAEVIKSSELRDKTLAAIAKGK